MEPSPKHCLLEYPPETIRMIREEYNLDETGKMDEAIDILDNWIKKQNHFVIKDFPRTYLEGTIIWCKGSIERAKSKIDKNCTLRTLMPKYYETFETKEDLKKLLKRFMVVVLPKFATDFNRVCMVKVFSDAVPSSLFDMHKYVVIMWEYLKAHDYFNGVTMIADARELNVMEFATGINVFELQQLSTLVMEGIGLRVKGIHILTASTAIDVAVTLIKQVVSAKIGERIMVHKTIESLQQCVPKDILPGEYGGSEESLEKLQDKWLDILSSKQNVEFMKEIKKMVTDEKCRQSDEFNNQYLGMPGTFRSLSVD